MWATKTSDRGLAPRSKSTEYTFKSYGAGRLQEQTAASVVMGAQQNLSPPPLTAPSRWLVPADIEGLKLSITSRDAVPVHLF